MSNFTATMAKPSVVYDGTTYRLWYSLTDSVGGGALNSNGVYPARIGFGTSTDGLTFTAMGTVLPAGATGAWDRPTTSNPSVILDGTSYRMAYAGGRANFPGGQGFSTFFSEGSIGIATAP